MLLIQTNRLHIERVTGAARSNVLDTYECAELNVHLNSFYLQMRGALDNLAWALHYELSVLGSPDEQDKQTRHRCDIFGTHFLKNLARLRPGLASQLGVLKTWNETFRNLRDPAAHRVPLYAIPGVIQEGSADADRLRQLHNEMSIASQAGKLDVVRDKFFESMEVGQYKPWFVQYSPDAYIVRNIGAQIAADEDQFLSAAEAVVRELLRPADEVHS